MDEDPIPHKDCYTAVFRPDPPEIPVSEKGAAKLRKLADEFGQVDGVQELERDERDYQVTVLLQFSD